MAGEKRERRPKDEAEAPPAAKRPRTDASENEAVEEEKEEEEEHRHDHQLEQLRLYRDGLAAGRTPSTRRAMAGEKRERRPEDEAEAEAPPAAKRLRADASEDEAEAEAPPAAKRPRADASEDEAIEEEKEEERWQPHDYQLELLRLYRDGLAAGRKGAVAYWSVGCGKTLGALLAASTHRGVGRVVVACPKSVLDTWEKSLALYRRHFQTDHPLPPVELHTHQRLCNAFDLREVNLDHAFLIVDEAHEFRTYVRPNEQWLTGRQKRDIAELRHKARRGKVPADAADRYIEQHDLQGRKAKPRAKVMLEAAHAARRVLLLTATPFVNNAYDLANLACMLRGRDDSYTGRDWRLEVESGTAHDDMYHVVVAESEDYPELVEHTVSLEMRGDYLAAYLQVERQVCAYYGYDPYAFLTGLRQANNKIDETLSPKVDTCVQLVVNQVLDGGKVLVYCQWLGNGIKAIRAHLANVMPSVKTTMINGEMSSEQRGKNIDEFNRPEGGASVCFISDAGGCGVNFDQARATMAVCVGSSWNPAREEQAFSRIRRMRALNHLPVAERRITVHRLLAVKPGADYAGDRGTMKSADSLVEDIRLRKKKAFQRLYPEILHRRLRVPEAAAA